MCHLYHGQNVHYMYLHTDYYNVHIHNYMYMSISKHAMIYILLILVHTRFHNIMALACMYSNKEQHNNNIIIVQTVVLNFWLITYMYMHRISIH